jgi:hypothetical protein
MKSSRGARGVLWRYFRFAFLPDAFFFPPDFAAALATFLGDFLLGLDFATDFLPDDDRPLLKMFSQLSEYCLFAPTRTTLMPAELQKEYEGLLLQAQFKPPRRQVRQGGQKRWIVLLGVLGDLAVQNLLTMLQFFIPEPDRLVCAFS